MAKNKKNLAEQKPSDAESYMMVDMGGKQRRVDRLDMSDEEWNTTKQTAIDKGIFKFAHDREAVQTKTEPMQGESQDLLAEKKASTPAAELPKREPSESFQPEKPSKPMEEKLKEPIQIKVGDSTYTVPADEASKLDLKKLTEQNKSAGEGTGTLGGKLRSVAAKLFEGATPSDQAQKDRELVDSIHLPSTPTAKPNTSKMRSMMSSEMADAERRRAGASAEFANDAVQPVPVAEPLPSRGPSDPTYIPPEAKGFLDTIKDGVSSVLSPSPAGDALLTGQPPVAAPPPAAGPSYPEKDRVAAEPNMLVDPPLVANAGNAQSPTGASMTKATPAPTGSTTAKVSMASKGVPDPSMPPLVDRRAELSAASDAHNTAAMASAESEAQGLRDQADVMRKGLREATDMELERRLADKVAQDHVREAQAAYTKTVEAMKAPEKLDPDRWWNSRPTAQKIFAVLSAGLTRGATLGMFQDAISRDIQAQQHDISNARIANQQKAEGQHNVYQMARQNGLDERAAYLTAEANAWDNVERSSKLASMSAKAPSVIAAAQEQAALANQQKIEKLAALDGHLETQAIERKKLFLENRKLDILAMKKAGSGKPKAGKALEPAMKEKIIAAEEGMQAIDRMLGLLDADPDKKGSQESTILGGVGDEIAKYVPKTQANRNNKAVELEKRSLERAIDQSAVQKADAEYYKDKLGGVGIANWTHEDLKNLRKKFEESKNATIDVNRRAGSNVAGFEEGQKPEMSDEDAYGILTGETF